eukprot:Anaeramoba_flamelloidesa89094_69.p1 GENE.a89094_69~~a89094_69.p1  ORF type:complete len:335 (+),score=82.94 a89094_69:27-1007(+)
MSNQKSQKQTFGLTSSQLLSMTGQEILFGNSNKKIKVTREQNIVNNPNKFNETVKPFPLSPPNQNQFTTQVSNNNTNQFNTSDIHHTFQNQQNTFYSQFTNKKRFEQPRRSMMRTSPSSESLSRGIDFDLYRKPTSKPPTPLNKQSLFSFDLAYPNNFSKQNKLSNKNNSFFTGKSTQTSNQTQNTNQPQNQNNLQTQTQTQTQTQKITEPKQITTIQKRPETQQNSQNKNPLTQKKSPVIQRQKPIYNSYTQLNNVKKSPISTRTPPKPIQRSQSQQPKPIPRTQINRPIKPKVNSSISPILTKRSLQTTTTTTTTNSKSTTPKY